MGDLFYGHLDNVLNECKPETIIIDGPKVLDEAPYRIGSGYLEKDATISATKGLHPCELINEDEKAMEATKPEDPKNDLAGLDEKICAPKEKSKVDPTRLIMEKLVVGRECNAVIIGDAITKEALLIDPGGDAKSIVAWVKKLKLKVVQILVTHAHFDHILAADKVRKSLKCPVWLHSKDLPLWSQLPEQMALLGLKRRGAGCIRRMPDPNFFLEDGSKLKVLGGVTIHTPGHTAGSVCFYFEDYNLLISGDTLFKAHVGRTDLPGGNSADLRRSVLHKLYKLPRETRVIPGHGRETTIGYEMENNRSCRVCTCKIKRTPSECAQREKPASMTTCNTAGDHSNHCHSSGGNHAEIHPTTGPSGCCDEADEDGDVACKCGAHAIPGKHQHVGGDMCSLL